MHHRIGIVALLFAAGAQAQGGTQLVVAVELPAAAQRLRDAGVPAAEVATALTASKDHGLHPGEATEVLDAAGKGEKLDNLGVFVKESLDRGLRGRALAQAIHEEQARRGIGKPDGGEGPPEGRGPEGGPPGQDGEPPGEKGDKGKAPEGGGPEKAKGKSGKGGH